MKAARLHAYHDALKLDSIAEPTIDGPLDVIVKIGAAGLCRTDLHIQEGQWASRSEVVAALHARPRERRLGPRDRLRRHQRRGRRHGHRASVHLLRPVHAVPGRRRHALPQRLVSGDQPRRRLRRAAEDERALGDQDRSARAQGHRRAGRRRPDRDPRRQEGDPGVAAGHQGGRDRRRRSRPHRDPVPEGDDVGRDHRRRPVRARRSRWPARSAPTRRSRSTARSTSTRSRRSPTASAPRRSSTSSARRARSRTGSR